ncbi:MAG: sigma-54 dependent transcriptional regulator [Planctomycetota bacterium]|nr:sigma-54 dependent transcriptional regulator [Planctomycetota bacterium]
MSIKIDVNTPDPDQAAFVHRPWPQRPPENSPFQNFRCLVLVGDQPRTLARNLTLAGLPSEAALPEESMGQALDRQAWDLVLLDADSHSAWAWEGPDPAGFEGVLIGIGEASGSDGPRPFSWLSTPCKPPEILRAFGHAREQDSLRKENQNLRAKLKQSLGFDGFNSVDPHMDAVLETARAVAPSRATVLILGESGTGKTRLARTLHENSNRKDAPFTVVHCGALPSALLESELFGHAKGAFTGAIRDKPGRFEEADGGTIFLDEINSAPLDLQVKLLRVIQERVLERVGENRTRKVDVRIIAASNQDLQQAIDAGDFREDLYWRLNVVSLALPPLRERPQDLARLVEVFLRRFAADYDRPIPRPDAGALEILSSYDWPGNIRQLENVIERAVLMADGDRLHVGALPADLVEEARKHSAGMQASEPNLQLGMDRLRAIIPLKTALEGPEKAILIHALEATQGNRKQAAEELGINRTTLFNKMRKHGLMDREFGAA